MRTYWVVFARIPQHELYRLFDFPETWFCVLIAHAENARCARGIAWRTVHGTPGLRFLVREGWRVAWVGRATEEMCAGMFRAPRISVGFSRRRR